jgi:hypothetical protein
LRLADSSRGLCGRHLNCARIVRLTLYRFYAIVILTPLNLFTGKLSL